MRILIRLNSFVLMRPVQVTVALPTEAFKYRIPYKTVWALHPAMSDADIFFNELCMEEYVAKEGFALVAPSLGNGFFVDTDHERQAFFLTDELFPVIRQTLPLAAEQKNNVLFGISMGGYGALHWGLDRPEMFSAIVVLSGVFERKLPEHPLLKKNRTLKALQSSLLPIMLQLIEDKNGNLRKEADLQQLLLRNTIEKHGMQPQVSLYCGDEDYLALPHCQDMQDRLLSCGWHSTLSILHGEHDVVFWRNVCGQALHEAFIHAEGIE